MRGESRLILGKLLCGWVWAERFHADLMAVYYLFFSKGSMMTTHQKKTPLTSSHLYTSPDTDIRSKCRFTLKKSALTCVLSHFKNLTRTNVIVRTPLVLNCLHWWKRCVTAYIHKASLWLPVFKILQEGTFFDSLHHTCCVEATVRNETPGLKFKNLCLNHINLTS